MCCHVFFNEVCVASAHALFFCVPQEVAALSAIEKSADTTARGVHAPSEKETAIYIMVCVAALLGHPSGFLPTYMSASSKSLYERVSASPSYSQLSRVWHTVIGTDASSCGIVTPS